MSSTEEVEQKNEFYNVYQCSNCKGTHKRTIRDKTGYYENKKLETEGKYRCRKCKNIQPVEHFEFVSKNKSDRRRKTCRTCRSAYQKAVREDNLKKKSKN